MSVEVPGSGADGMLGRRGGKNYGLWMFMVDIPSGKRLHSELENHHLD